MKSRVLQSQEQTREEAAVPQGCPRSAVGHPQAAVPQERPCPGVGCPWPQPPRDIQSVSYEGCISGEMPFGFHHPTSPALVATAFRCG